MSSYKYTLGIFLQKVERAFAYFLAELAGVLAMLIVRTYSDLVKCV